MLVKNQTTQKTKPPDELRRLQSGLEKIYSALKPLQVGAPEQIQRAQKSEGEAGEKKGKQGEKEKASASEGVDWGKLYRRSVLLHELWNSIEPDVMKRGARLDDVEGFEGELNLLSNKLAKRDRYGSQVASNNAASLLVKFIQLYGGGVPPELLQLRCLVRSVTLKAEKAEWTGAKSDLMKMSSVWSRARSETEGGDENTKSKIQYSIDDLNTAVDAKDNIAVMVKGNVLEKNIDLLINSLQKGAK
ncbi:MAG: hypothetical protein ACPLTR_03455 [Thermacetogeniaceae bacterium]